MSALVINGALVRYEIRRRAAPQYTTARPHLLVAFCECGEMFLSRAVTTAEANDPESVLGYALTRHRASGWCKRWYARTV